MQLGDIRGILGVGYTPNHSTMRTVFEEISPKGGQVETEVFLYDAPADAESLGGIAIFFDTRTLPDALRYFGALIAGTFRRNYFTSNKSMQRAFTDALRSVNDALAEEARSGTGQWIGMLRALIIASDGKSLVVTTTGGIDAHLTRNGQLIEIPLEAGEGTRPFGSYTAGEINQGDVLLAGTRGVLDEHNIRQLFTDHPQKAAKQLRKVGGTALLMHADGGGAQKTVPAIGNKKASVYRSAIIQFAGAGKRAGTSLFHFAKNITGAIKARLQKSPKPQEVLEKGHQAAKESLKKGRVALSGVTNILQKIQAIKKPSLPKVSVSLPTFINRRVIIAGMILLFAGAGTFLVSVRSQEDEDSQQAANALAIAYEAIERGETQIILGDTESAIDAFEQGLFALEGIMGGDDIRAELLSRKNALSGIIGIDVRTVLSFAGFPVGINATFLATGEDKDANELPLLALAGSDHPAVWLNSVPEPTGGTFFVLPLEFKSGIVDIESFSSNTYVAITNEGMALLDGSSRSLLTKTIDEGRTYTHVAAAAGTGFALSSDLTIDTFTLDQESGDFVISPWLFRPDKRLVDATDMAILNGEPLVLLSDNTFLHFRRARSAIHYTIEGFDWDGSATALESVGEDRLLVLDSANGRILLCETNGDILEQYEVPEILNGHDITSVNDGLEVFVLTSEKLLALTLPKIPEIQTE